MLLAFAVLHWFRIPGDLVSLGGLAIGLGMMVDATIIMVEKIHSSLQNSPDSRPIRETVLSAGKEVGRPIFFAIAIIIIVFVPIFTLQEVEGKMFRPLALAVSIAMLGSLFYALIVAPVFYSFFPGRASDGRKKVFLFPRFYKSILVSLLAHPVLVVSVVVILLISGGWAFSRLGKVFVPTLEEGTINVLAHMDPNISLREISELVTKLEKEALAFPEVERVISDIGYGEVGPHIHHTNFACMTLGLQPKDKWKTVKTQEELVSKMNDRLAGFPGVSVSFSQPIQHEVDELIAGTGTQVVAKLFGPDIGVLRNKAAEIERALSEVNGVSDLRTEQVAGQTQLQIKIDRDEIARHGMNVSEVQHSIRNAIGGERAGKVFEEEKTFDIVVRFAEPYRKDIEAIESLLLTAPGGYRIPLAQMAKINLVTGLRQISREDARRFISIQCNVRGRDVGGFVEEARKKISGQVTLPPGYMISWGGQFELQQAANRRLLVIAPITLLLIFLVLCSSFNSIKSALLIILNIPLALVGGIFGLFIFGENLSIPSSIGFIVLFGIAIEDGLVLISRFKYLHKEGLNLTETVIEGSLSKLRPVLMTSVTTALGLLPLIIATGPGSEIQKPLAIVVVGGLASSTLLTLFVLPTLYKWTRRREEKET
jgi:cobalt-zinc-cadmium resistance protein CzcA